MEFNEEEFAILFNNLNLKCIKCNYKFFYIKYNASIKSQYSQLCDCFSTQVVVENNLKNFYLKTFDLEIANSIYDINYYILENTTYLFEYSGQNKKSFKFNNYSIIGKSKQELEDKLVKHINLL